MMRTQQPFQLRIQGIRDDEVGRQPCGVLVPDKTHSQKQTKSGIA